MNKNELNVELVRHGISIPKAADAIGIGKKAFYDKMKGKSQFKQVEMLRLKQLLELDDKRVGEIFFTE